ncbi:transcriptional regulator [Nocardiopsis flavescens]|uniref:transcriptional regulator n=1 Tax=Nocardiopsis flavescens TaxID=758803 RepID=UPI00364984D9
MIADPTAFAVVFVALFAAHQVGDHWVQSSCQATAKGGPGKAGRIACAKHVLSLTVTKLLFLAPILLLTGASVHPLALVIGLGADAASHYWADRRTTLAALAARVGRGEFHRLGTPRPGHDDNPSLGTGAYALDQSWHIGWLAAASLIIAVGGGA